MLICLIQDSAALIECLRTGNEPPGDVPIIHLEVDDPPCAPSRSNVDHSVSNQRPAKTENGDNGIHYASIPVSPGPSANGSPFIGADPIVEPTETHRLPTVSSTSYPSLSRAGRRFSASSMGLGSNGNASAHSTFLWKVFSRRSKVSLQTFIEYVCHDFFRTTHINKTIDEMLMYSIYYLMRQTALN